MRALFIANFPSNTGYAWDTIETVFAGVAEKLSPMNFDVCVAYASLTGGEPVRMLRAPVNVLEYDYMASVGNPAVLFRFLLLLRREGIQLLYLTDQPTWALRYLMFRLVGVRRIVIHDRTSGLRSTSRWLLLFKRLLHRSPLGADRVVAVSQFVAARLRDVNGTNPARTICIYNGIDLERFYVADTGLLRDVAKIPPELPVIFYSGRANLYKGAHVLLEAVATLQEEGRRVGLALCGDGPDLEFFRAEAERLQLCWTTFLGKRDDVPELLAGATICVVPSLWAEAFGLAVVEAMAAAKPVIATSTGGIPELIEEGHSGMLVPPGDARALTDALRTLLDDSALRLRLGRQGQASAREQFSVERTIQQLADALVS